MTRKNYLPLALLAALAAPAHADPLGDFEQSPGWATAEAVSAVGETLQLAGTADANSQQTVLHNAVRASAEETGNGSVLESDDHFEDAVISFDYLLAGEAQAAVYIQGRYAIALNNENNEWQSLRIRYRAPRFSDAGKKIEAMLLMDVRRNGEVTERNLLFSSESPDAPFDWENDRGPLVIVAEPNTFALRNFSAQPANFDALSIPPKSGEPTNESELVDVVAKGRELFQATGCNVCHATERGSDTVSTGPNLFGLFKPEPRARDVIEGGENHRFTIKANRNYLHKSLRSPDAQLAVRESGEHQGTAYPAVMPAISAEVLSDSEIDAVGAYLRTLNSGRNRGPLVKLVPQGSQAGYDPLKDDLQLLVSHRTRLQRGPMAGVSGRAIHVGQTNGINYTFDPRILAVAKIWQGGFLDLSGEFRNRGGKGLETGYESRALPLGDEGFLLAPLGDDGEPIDLSFKSSVFEDYARVRKSLYSEQDHLDRLDAADAQFLGYQRDSRDADQVPAFRYRVGDNTLAIRTRIAKTGKVTLELTGQLNEPQAFVLNEGVLQDAKASSGHLARGQWRLESEDLPATLEARVVLAEATWRPPASEFDYRVQPARRARGQANLPRGYRIENYYPPRDNYGREQLFEALGLAQAEDGTIVVATRTAGVWRLVDGEWRQFAEGTFDSLGVMIEDKHGLQVVVGQKPELTRISDTNGDGVADRYDTLFDAHSFHNNYHAYMHGPARGGDGAYYIGLNLADGHDHYTYKAGGPYLGSNGGFSGWTVRVEPDGDFRLWAKGFRSPAGIGVSPDNRLWVADNQGGFMSTSKLFAVTQGGFYGHPASLVDLPGMTPESAAIAWDKVSDQREPAVVLFPHNRVANSPGNPAWDTTGGRFGPFSGQMFIGDQTQSNLLRVTTEKVGGVEQGSIMPFATGLESGVLRPLFLNDGSLLLGQTGRGWQSKGGHLAALQRIVWDGETLEPAISAVSATADGFRLTLTHPLKAGVDSVTLVEALNIESWVYRDAPQYGSEEMGLSDEAIASVQIADDRRSFAIKLQQLEHQAVHPQQTARVYHVALTNDELFKPPAPALFEAYYTLHQFAP